VRVPAGVHGGPGRTHRRTEGIGERLDRAEVPAGATSAGTTIAASVSSGRPVASRGLDAVIRAVFAASEIDTSISSTSGCVPAACAASGVEAFGLTVMIGVPLVTVA